MKSIFLFLSLFACIVTYSQSFDILNEEDVLIEDNYSFIDNSLALTLTKLHIRNTAMSAQNFKISVKEISNPTAADLQICFGGGCFVVAAGTIGDYSPEAMQEIDSESIFSDLKIAPFCTAWDAGDSAVWEVTIFNEENVDDNTIVEITWKSNASIGVGIDKNVKENISIYPNPASSIITINAPNNSFTKIKITNLTGAIVLFEDFTTAMSLKHLDVSTLPKGVYIVELKGVNKATIVRKLVIE